MEWRHIGHRVGGNAAPTRYRQRRQTKADLPRSTSPMRWNRAPTAAIIENPFLAADRSSDPAEGTPWNRRLQEVLEEETGPRVKMSAGHPSDSRASFAGSTRKSIAAIRPCATVRATTVNTVPSGRSTTAPATPLTIAGRLYGARALN